MANHTKRVRKLRNFLINPRYQLKYVTTSTLAGFILILINSSIFYWFIRENYKILVDLSPMEDEAKQLLYLELNKILILLGCFSVFFLFLSFLVGIVLSHRTAGPLYQFKQVFKLIQNGETGARIQLRPTDEFQDVADECNRMIDKLQGKA